MVFGPIIPQLIGGVIPQGMRYPYSSAVGPFTTSFSPIDIIPNDVCPGATDVLYDWMGVSRITDGCAVQGCVMPNTVVQAPNGPYASGSTPIYVGQIVDQYGFGVPAADLTVVTLSIVDTLTGTVINGVSQVNILNTGRGAVDNLGNLTITLQTGDTSMSETVAARIQRSLIIDWTGTGTIGTGRHQVDFVLLALAGA